MKRLRKSRRYSQEEMGKHFGVAQGTYSGWENKAEPNYETLVQIAGFFAVTVDDLLQKEMTNERTPARKTGQPELELMEQKVEGLIKVVELLADKAGIDISGMKTRLNDDLSKL
ncbi:MAG TPA: XRE family transcriptional regulator [Bacteroidetes bacterium]|nr:XRE family transcriptional regulator [Bacteroidota bacterium]